MEKYISENYCSEEIIGLLQDKGYVGSTNTYLDKDGFRVKKITHQSAMKWLREVHKIGIFPTTYYRLSKTFDGHNYGCTLINLENFDLIGNFEDCTFPADSYEDTCEAAIKYCLENLI